MQFCVSFAGPVNYPLVGSIPALRAKTPLHETVFQLSKEYGPIMGLFLGPSAKCVAINGYDAVKHVLSRDDLAFRPDGILMRARAYNKRLGQFLPYILDFEFLITNLSLIFRSFVQ